MSRIGFNKLLNTAQNCSKDFVQLGKNVHKLDTTKSYANLAHAVQKLQKQDFNIDDQFFNKNMIDQYSSSTIFETKNCDIQFGLFLLPKGYYIPMHDHPGMFVITKILHGSARKLSYNLNVKVQQKHQFLYPQQIKKKTLQNQPINHLKNPIIDIEKQFDNIVTEDMLDMVRPTEGNLHAFYASEDQDFVFLNCFIPHYDDITRFTNFYDIVDEEVDNTQAIMLKGAPQEYQKRTMTLDCENMPFFQENQQAFQNNKQNIISKDCLLTDFLNRTDFHNQRTKQIQEDQIKIQQQYQSNKNLSQNQYLEDL